MQADYEDYSRPEYVAPTESICVDCGKDTPLEYLHANGRCEACQDKHDDERAEVIAALKLGEKGKVN